MTSMLSGTLTAVPTFFKDDLSLDIDTLKRFVEYQIDGGVDGLVLCGTTSESPTLTDQEKLAIVKNTFDVARGKCKIVVGCGGNNTQKVADFACILQSEFPEIHSILSVTPYYNKPRPEMIVAHYEHIASEFSGRIMVYNVPSRTALNIDVATLGRLFEIENIIGIKDASGDMVQAANSYFLASAKGKSLLTGDDSTQVEFNQLGGNGVISVVSNLYPAIVKKVQNATTYEDAHHAFDPIRKVSKMLTSLSINPVPVKYALHKMGFGNNKCRLPLVGSSFAEIDAEITKLS